MLRYEQTTGKLFDREGHLLGVGYSGLNEGKNNPAMQDHPTLGPIPRGKWYLGPLVDSLKTGKYIMHLTPAPDTITFGRTDFEMHGDSLENPSQASHGCIIQPRVARLAAHALAVSNYDDSIVEVVQ